MKELQVIIIIIIIIIIIFEGAGDGDGGAPGRKIEIYIIIITTGWTKKTECCWGHIASIPGTSCRWKSQLDSVTPDPGNSFLIQRKSRIKPSPVKSI